MPNRYIRASAIESESMCTLSWQAEVFLRRLWNRVDDFGRFSAKPQLLRAATFPLQLEVVRDADMTRLLLECEKAGQLYAYSVLGKQYLVINRWERGRAIKSEYPRPHSNICSRVLTYVNRRWQKLSDVPDSDSDSDSDSDPDLPPPPAAGEEAKKDDPPPKPDDPPPKDDPIKRKQPPRNLLHDALAEATGSNPYELPKTMARLIGLALADIKGASPDVTPEEIHRRAQRYRIKWPKWVLTGQSLAKHWAACGVPVTSQEDLPANVREYMAQRDAARAAELDPVEGAE